jgi:hypothetical protein
MIFHRKRFPKWNSNQYLGVFFLFLVTSFSECPDDADPIALADDVCDCVKEAEGNLVSIAQCYTHAQEIKEKKLPAPEDKKTFDSAILKCFGGSVPDVVKKFKQK